MPVGSGGARPKSGPTKQQQGSAVTALPSEGYTKRAPGITNYIPKPTARHRDVWEELWQTPQACAWSKDKWRWPSVAILCRLMVRAEDADAPAAIFGELAKMQTKVGLSEEGMRFLGWAVARDEVAEKAATKKPPAKKRPAPVRRLRSVAK